MNVSNMIEEHNRYVTNMLLKAHTMDTLQTLQQMRYKKKMCYKEVTTAALQNCSYSSQM